MVHSLRAARAPASIGNVAVGFDILGQAFPVLFDTVTARAVEAPGLTLGAVSGLVTRLPQEVAHNTALRAGQAVLAQAGHPGGVVLDVDKGVPMSSGMGGSAASAVAAAVAVNALLGDPLDRNAVLACAFEGERASADPPPVDNVAASLYGGVVLLCEDVPLRVRPVPVPDDLVCLLVHPDITVETRMARAVLKPDVPLATAVLHARHVALFLAGCYEGDRALLRLGMKDALVEPQRAHLVAPFAAAKAAALEAGAIGCSLSGSGPSVFAWAAPGEADAVAAALGGAFETAGIGYRSYAAPVAGAGAQILDAPQGIEGARTLV